MEKESTLLFPLLVNLVLVSFLQDLPVDGGFVDILVDIVMEDDH